MNYLRSALGPVPQTEPLPGQVANSAGGFSYGIDDWKRLDRFLVLGSEGGSFYATEQKLTKENAQAVRRCLAADGPRAVKAAVDISVAGRAPKNDPAIFVLALALVEGNEDTKRAAREAIPAICRIGTHLHHLAAFYKALGGGWGRGTKRAFARWFTAKPASELAYQLVKYQSRDGWSNKDLLRLSHPKAPSVDHAALFAWATGKEIEDASLLPPVVQAFEMCKTVAAPKNAKSPALDLIRQHNLSREMLPTEWLKEPVVWEAMLPKMGLTALLRNLANMTRIGLIAPGSDGARLAAFRISDKEQLTKSRVHPLAVLNALRVYAKGYGDKSDKTWTPVPSIVDALDAAFYASFGNVETTGARYVLALDVSGSMSSNIAGTGLSCREAATAMAMVTAAVEKDCVVLAFDHGVKPIDVSPRRRLDDNLRITSQWSGGATDCALPFIWAMQNKLKADAFCVYTDSETYYGQVHPRDALRAYRKAVQGAKSAVIGMVSNGFTIADPNDPGQLDVVGFDTATPNILADFFR